MTENDYDAIESGIAVLSEHDPAVVHGVAIGEGDVTMGMSGKRTVWPRDALTDAADKLAGKPLVRNHPGTESSSEGLQASPPSIDDVIGEVTDAKYRDGVGILFEAEVDDESVAQKIDRGRVDVSPVMARELGEFDDELEAHTVDRIHDFRDLGVVSEGAAPSNNVQTGPMAALSAEALSAAFDAGQTEALASVHSPSFETTSTGDWSAPNLGDFGEDPDLADVDDHFLISKTEFPPENYTDLSVPVVSPDGALNLNALQNAAARVSQVGGVGDDVISRARSTINRLANENFEDANFGSEANAQTVDELAESSAGNSDDSDTMTEDNSLSDAEQELLAAVDDPRAAVEALREQAQFEEPYTMEYDEFEALTADLQDAKEAFAEALSQRIELDADKIANNFSWEALREEFEDEDGNLSHEALVQTPETKQPETSEAEDAGPTDDDKERIEQIDTKLSMMSNSLPNDRVEALRAEAAELADVDDYDAALEVL